MQDNDYTPMLLYAFRLLFVRTISPGPPASILAEGTGMGLVNCEIRRLNGFGKFTMKENKENRLYRLLS